MVGYQMTQAATKAVLAEAGLSPKDIKVYELHDCFLTNELILLDAMGFCEEGQAHYLVRNGDITYSGKGPLINPSGGLISKGHLLGVTGLVQCAELTWQLRGWAKNRLVNGVNAALQHNIGLGGAIVVTVYKRADSKNNDTEVSNKEIAELSGFGYNSAVENRFFTPDQAHSVRSKTAGCDYAFSNTVDLIAAWMFISTKL
jgi:sterol carrier protein 2